MAGKKRRRRTGRLLASSCNPEYFPARPGIGLTGRYWRPWPRTNPGQVVQREKKRSFQNKLCPLVRFYVGGDDKVSGSCLLTQTSLSLLWSSVLTENMSTDLCPRSRFQMLSVSTPFTSPSGPLSVDIVNFTAWVCAPVLQMFHMIPIVQDIEDELITMFPIVLDQTELGGLCLFV